MNVTLYLSICFRGVAEKKKKKIGPKKLKFIGIDTGDIVEANERKCCELVCLHSVRGKTCGKSFFIFSIQFSIRAISA